MADQSAVSAWLLDADPSIRWQVLRDILHEPEEVVAAERARVAREGWGAALLALQTPDGHWNDDTQHGWMPTTDALHLLMTLGPDPADAHVTRAIDLVKDRITWFQLDGRPFFDGETEACINGRILAAGAYFGADVDRLLALLLNDQLDDGGWNCEAPPSTRSSFNSTICVLEGLLAYEQARGATPAVTQSRERAHAYLLERHMLRSLTSGEVINQSWARFSFPVVWYYDVLRGLDYLRSAGVAPDERVAEAVSLVAARRQPDGFWLLDEARRDQSRIPVTFETEVGAPSRWNTLRALRVLEWYAGNEPAR
ncbi:hypothetical protein [Hyphomicrobium sp. CS1GBMeth3]|uniref:hypothetical protein n=1 Tax=Hyphomicrobium sp. CS1GBMeth3 TaxID=1892845 RepID=UPI0009316BDB|nr:hypothetical protein [Hyphomicrobium sp. CS1GBMeth3]